MAYRKTLRQFSFVDLAIEIHANKNSSLAVLKQLNLTIDCRPIEQLLDLFYHTGKRTESGKAYTPMLLFRCLVHQK